MGDREMVEAEWRTAVDGEASKPNCQHVWNGGFRALRESNRHRQCGKCGELQILKIVQGASDA